MTEAKIPFKVCESDNKPGLTFDEVRNCGEEDDAVTYVIDTVLKKHTGWDFDILDFESADLNGDGVLLFEEWKTFAKGWDE